MAQAQGNGNTGIQIGRMLFLLPVPSSVAEAALHIYYLVLYLYALILTVV